MNAAKVAESIGVQSILITECLTPQVGRRQELG
jgi:hypothetical protein